MKRCWIGVSLLVLLLGGGIFSTWQMQRSHDPMAEYLNRACAMAETGQWEIALDYVNRSMQKWEDNWGFSAAFADHEPMERINALFAQLEVCGRNRETVSYCLLCAQLREELEAMGEAHRFVWWNLL